MAKDSLFRSTQWMLSGLVVALGLSFWLGSFKLGRPVQSFHSDPHRLSALKTFEPVIEFAVPDRLYPLATADALRDKFPAASAETLETLATDLRTLNARLKAMDFGRKTLALNWQRWQPAGTSPRQSREAIEAAHWLAERASRLELLDWSGLRRSAASQPMQVPETVFQQDNPWRGANGCIYLHGAKGELLYLDEHRSNHETCPVMAPADIDHAKVKGIKRHPGERGKDDPAWALPDDLAVVLADLERIRSPQGETYRLYTQTLAEDDAKGKAKPHGPNRIVLRGHESDVGFNLHLTLNPALQATVQQWARCYTGDRQACAVAGLEQRDSLQRLFEEMHENAPMRMAAVAVVDVASGEIEALGSAHTACYRQDHSGRTHGTECPDAPFRPRYDADRLLNHALFTDAMPASTIKPIMALAFLQDNPAYRSDGSLRSQLWHDLKHSNSVGFLDRLLCGREVGSGLQWKSRSCERPHKTQAAATALGWNLGCGTEFDPDCAKLDVLFGRPAGQRVFENLSKHELGLELLYGRLFAEPPGDLPKQQPTQADDWAMDESSQRSALGYRLMQDFSFTETFAQQCSSGAYDPGRRRWRGCNQSGARISNEGWGQGGARVIPLAVAGLMARLAAAANGQATQAYPHLLKQVSDAKGQQMPLAVEKLAQPSAIDIESELARLVLRGMDSHRSGGSPNGGTAHSACKEVFGKHECDAIDWIAGKTGTPPFGFDAYLLSSIRKQCYAADGKPKTACNLLPYKWYAAAFKTQDTPNAAYDKAIVVLSERNWSKKTQQVQAPGDSGVNLSAQLAFRVIKTLHSAVVVPVRATNSVKKAKP